MEHKDNLIQQDGEKENYSLGSQVRGGLQWIVFVVVALFALTTLVPLDHIDVPGAPIVLIYSAIGVGIVTTLLHFPYVFWRLSRRAKSIPYVGFLVLFVITINASFEAGEAYERTPEGAREAAAAAKEAEMTAAIDLQREAAERTLAELGQAKDDAEKYSAQLESCFTTFGHRLPALEDSIKNSLHNPRSFEHVETVAIVPDSQSNNVAMTFRAENGFGALRAATVRAQLIADGCEVQNIGDPEDE